jgi:hypothetical protein
MMVGRRGEAPAGPTLPAAPCGSNGIFLFFDCLRRFLIP